MIAAVVVGGVAISGGRGTLAGTLIGVALLGSIGPALFFLGTKPQWEKAIQGLIILLAVASDALYRERTARLSTRIREGTRRKDEPRITRIHTKIRLSGPWRLVTGIDSLRSCFPWDLIRGSAVIVRESDAISDEPRHPWFEPAQAILAGILLLEVAVFSVIGTNFLTLANAFEVLRLSVEIGLLAVALTPVITSGGIDLSVGSLMGLSAVVFGMLWRDAGPADRRGRGGDAGPGRAGGQRQRAADHAGPDPAADRDPRLVLAVPRPGRGLDRAASRTTRTSPARSCSWARATRWAASRRRCRSSSLVAVGVLGVAAPVDGRPRARRRSASRPRAPATPGCRSTGWSASVYVLSGLVASLAAIIYVAAPGPGQGRRRHRLRAGGDHGRGPGRHVDLRRPGERARHAAGPLRHRRAPQRHAAGRPARRAGRRPDRHPAPGRHRARPPGPRPSVAAPAPPPPSPIHPRRFST